MAALTASLLLVPLHVVIISFFLTVAIPELKYTVVYSHILNIWVFLYFTNKGFLMKGFHNKNSKTRENENIENSQNVRVEIKVRHRTLKMLNIKILKSFHTNKP